MPSRDIDVRAELAALIIAHPGHELRVHGWLETARPMTFVLTKGDGHDGVSRVASTLAVVAASGAQPGCIFGRLADRELYDALLKGHYELFLALLDELAKELATLAVRYIVADADDGYNPSHDICHYLAIAAAALVSRGTAAAVHSFDFPLVGAPCTGCDEDSDRAIHLHLDDEAFDRKLKAACSYPELRAEVDRAVKANGEEAFRCECLRPARLHGGWDVALPFYERYGEAQVAAGRYSEIIRYDRHVRPLRDVLFRAAGIL